MIAVAGTNGEEQGIRTSGRQCNRDIVGRLFLPRPFCHHSPVMILISGRFAGFSNLHVSRLNFISSGEIKGKRSLSVCHLYATKPGRGFRN